MPKKKETKTPTPWEIAKPVLERDILEGSVTEDMMPKQVVALRPLIYGVVGKGFGSNYRNLQRTITKWLDEVEEDRLLLEHDKQLYTLAKDDPSCWHGSDAQKLLPEDLDAIIVNGMLPDDNKPKELWESRDEYKIFELDVFRGHIHQILRSRRETPYWTYKMKKKPCSRRSLADGLAAAFSDSEDLVSGEDEDGGPSDEELAPATAGASSTGFSGSKESLASEEALVAWFSGGGGPDSSSFSILVSTVTTTFGASVSSATTLAATVLEPELSAFEALSASMEASEESWTAAAGCVVVVIVNL